MMEDERGNYGFKLVFWGLLISVLYFRLHGFNIIPDFLGYIAIFVGLGSTKELSSQFELSRIAVLILVPFSLADIYEPPTGQITFWPISVLSSILYLVFTWFLLGGLVETNRNYDNPSLSSLAEKVQIAAAFVLLFPAIIAFQLSLIFPPLAIIITAMGLLVGIIELYVVYHTAETVENKHENHL
ncbi:MAG: hypothetical protein R6V83_00775 [Candidatus Thorarchaeota archaeon]